jgi:hypothetical protein
MLSALPESEQAAEIGEGKRRLEEYLDDAVQTFSYPYGGTGAYTSRTVELVKEAGFQVACANIAGPVVAGLDRFELPRVIVRNTSGGQFARALDELRIGGIQ